MFIARSMAKFPFRRLVNVGKMKMSLLILPNNVLINTSQKVTKNSINSSKYGPSRPKYVSVKIAVLTHRQQ